MIKLFVCIIFLFFFLNELLYSFFLVIKTHEVSGSKLEVKKAVSKDVASASRGRRGGRGASGGRGQSWGGPNNWGGECILS